MADQHRFYRADKVFSSFEQNRLGRDWVTGDNHGCVINLIAALIFAGFNFNVDRLFCTGDLGDRGEESHLALWLLKQKWFFCVRGNHDELAMRIGRGFQPSAEVVNSYSIQWLFKQSEQFRQDYAYYLALRPLAIEVQTEKGLVGIVHADIPTRSWGKLKKYLTEEGMSNNQYKSLAGCLQFDRSRYDQRLNSRVEDLHALIVGHTSVPEVMTLNNVVYVDTGSGKRDRDTGIVGYITVLPLDELPV